MIKQKINLDTIILGVLAAFSFLLPLQEKVNTWLLITLVVVSLYKTIRDKLWFFLKENYHLLLIPALLLMIRIIGIFYASDISIGFKESTRALSFVFIPYSFLIISRIKTNSTSIKKIIFWSLTIGCLLAAIICWGSVINKVIEHHEPFTQLFTWKKSNVYLTEVIKIHPPYLGALVLSVIVFLYSFYVHKQKLSKKIFFPILLILIFAFFLFHLVVRNSILFFLIISLGYIAYHRKWKAFLIGVVLIGGGAFMIINNGNHYLKRKYYKMLDFSDEKIGDKRFDRLEASYIVFKNHPIIGAGMGKVDVERYEEYVKMNDKRAIENNFNSHNQYLEYLSTFGVIGFSAFIIVLVWLFRNAWINQEYFLTILLALCMFACVTESFLERELGIKFFSLVAGLIIYETCRRPKAQKK